MPKKGKVLNPFAHARQRPDTYIGSVATVNKHVWICNVKIDQGDESPRDEDDASEKEVPEKNNLFIKKDIRWNKGLIRLFIEGISNAIDNKWRSEKEGIPMKKIDISIDMDPDSDSYGKITIWNDGAFIDVEKQEFTFDDYRTQSSRSEQLYPAEVYFGEMLAGTNFEDNEERKTSGKNGIGGKAIAIFSSLMEVEHTDPVNGKKFYQKYENAGKKRTKPHITSYKAKTGYTQISFIPDYEYFGYPVGSEDFCMLLKRYAYECAAVTGVNVTFNGEKITVKDVTKLARLYFPDTKENCMVSLKAPNGDECVIVEKGLPDTDTQENVDCISWVNGLNTPNGGVHVDAWKEVVFDKFVRTFNARKPIKGEKVPLKASAKEVHPYFLMFVNSETFKTPTFDSQTKELRTGPPVELNPNKEKEFTNALAEAAKKMMKWNFITLLEDKLAAKADRTQGKKEKTTGVGYSKNYTPANFAGKKKHASKCSLFITEGLSAKTFAGSLISAMQGQDYYGALAIKGKFINSQSNTIRMVDQNEEVKQLKSVLGLRRGVVYTDLEELNYGKIIIFTDQDDDGFHIRGLLLNFFWFGWPSLFDLKSEDGTPYLMFESFSSMVTMATWGKTGMKMFYSNPEFENWYEKEGKDIRGLKVKYYKGLGTHRPGDEKLYIKDTKKIAYTLDGNEKSYMHLGFGENTSERKEWVTKDITKPGEEKKEIVMAKQIISGKMSLSKFVNDYLIIYHKMALTRAIPNMYDGFKDSQRKIYYGISSDQQVRNKLTSMETLSGIIKKNVCYHHGDISLKDTMVKMAQGFAGSNNIPLLVNDGQFGTREYGGSDAAAHRYISSCLEDISSIIFNPLDEPILQKQTENGEDAGYLHYIPIIPMILVNGANGIATGFSCNIPSYNPEDIVERMLKWLEEVESGVSPFDVELEEMTPWYFGFSGTNILLSKNENQYVEWDGESHPVSWKSMGNLEKSTNGWWKITEYPIGLQGWSIVEYVEKLKSGEPIGKGKNKKSLKSISEYKQHNTPNTIHIEFKPTKDFIPDIDVAGNFKILQKVHSLNNIHALDENGYPRKYSSIIDLLKDFCCKRLNAYIKRKTYWLKEYKKEYEKESDRYKFVLAVINRTLKMNRPVEEVYASMEEMGLRKQSNKEDSEPNYSYLLSMQMGSMTVEKLAKIKKDVDAALDRFNTLKSKTKFDLMREELGNFSEAWEKFKTTRKNE